MHRRDFIEKSVRGGLVALLAVLTGTLLSRRQVRTGSKCTGNYQCHRCRSLEECMIPEAIKTRENGRKG